MPYALKNINTMIFFVLMKFFIFVLLAVIFILPVFSQYAPIVLDPSYEHDKWKTNPRDLMFYFAAYTVSFDSNDDDNGDSIADIWGIPEWVSFEIKKTDKKYLLEDRPKWMTDINLYNAGIAPGDNSYTVSGVNNMKEVKSDYRFVRGHMCPKTTAERISKDAAYNTHTLLNAVPQLQWQNNGVWKKIEELSNEWADKYERIWVICGPVFFNKTPSMRLGQNNEMKIAIPDALFKIIIRENPENIVKTISFLIPNIVPKENKNPVEFITNIDRIEELTGLDFLTAIGSAQEIVEKIKGDLYEW